MAPGNYLAKVVSLPELQLVWADGRSLPGWFIFKLESTSECRACPHCATLCFTIHDHRWVKCLNAPLRDRKVELRIHKKRYFCKSCQKPFMEILHGIFKRARLTERLRRHILWCCSRFQSLIAVAKAVGCSGSSVRRSFYAHLQIHFKRHLQYGFPKKLGMDEHFFGMKRKPDFPALTEQKYHTTLVDLKRHRLYRAMPEKDQRSIFNQLKDEPGAQNVEDVVIDMSEGNRNVAYALFPNVRITIDPFHVLKLLQRPLNHERHKVMGRKKKKTNLMASLLLKSGKNLEVRVRWDLQRFLKDYPTLRAIYEAKERLHRLYRCKGRKWAEKSMDHLLKDLDAQSSIQPLKTLAHTLRNWRVEILNHFDSKLTNAMTEGFNNKIKLVKRMGYGFRNEENYDYRILYACYH